VSYGIELSGTADQFLAKLSRSQPKDAAALEDRLDELAEDPHPPGCLPLTGYPGVLPVRVGNYRICYRFENGRLLVFGLVISKRGDVHEVIKRHLGR
jgi:mRNA interferase RelE/StbE